MGSVPQHLFYTIDALLIVHPGCHVEDDEDQNYQ